MKFDFWTFAFQIVNFAVLLFILRRLFFKPVREIMAKRAAQVQAALDAAEKAQTEAGQIRAGLAFEQERVGRLRVEMLEKLQAEVEEHRQRRLAGGGGGGAGAARPGAGRPRVGTEIRRLLPVP